jgi:hypothetical protein
MLFCFLHLPLKMGKWRRNERSGVRRYLLDKKIDEKQKLAEYSFHDHRRGAADLCLHRPVRAVQGGISAAINPGGNLTLDAHSRCKAVEHYHSISHLRSECIGSRISDEAGGMYSGPVMHRSMPDGYIHL